jgi:hypothetical protein
MLLHQLFSKLPPSARETLKRALRSNGHSRSVMDPLTARKDALGKKRLDRSLRQLIEVLGVDGAQLLSGRACVDFGAGYVPMDAVSMWLLGAHSVIAVDYNDIASLRAMCLGLARADFSITRDLLRDVAPSCNWKARLQILEGIGASRCDMSFDNIPFRYIAPLDVIADPEGLPAFDFVWSTSVLEHIAPSKLISVLGALNGRAAPGAVHVHRVDLRDHRDFDRAPYGFLDPNLRFDPESQADVRGNAMTLEAWELELANHPELGLRVAAADQGRPSLVPIDPNTGKPVISRVADCLTIVSSSIGVDCALDGL